MGAAAAGAVVAPGAVLFIAAGKEAGAPAPLCTYADAPKMRENALGAAAGPPIGPPSSCRICERMFKAARRAVSSPRAKAAESRIAFSCSVSAPMRAPLEAMADMERPAEEGGAGIDVCGA